jgi:hypothetical protein
MKIVICMLSLLVLCGCKTYVPVPSPTPCCLNPYHDHYIAPPMLLWKEHIVTESFQRKVEHRYWTPQHR